MSEMSLKDLAEKIGDIDFAMFSTRAEGGEISSRPMSNNGDVEFDGDSYFFTMEQSRMVADIKRDPRVGLAMQGKGGLGTLVGKPPIFISIEAEAELIREKAMFEKHWNKDLERWFKQGVDTPGLVLVKAKATRIKYWDGEEDGEVKL